MFAGLSEREHKQSLFDISHNYVSNKRKINPENAIKLSEKLRMSKINLFVDTIVYLYRCVTKIFLCNYHELSFYIKLSI
jgi:hypothetical protein